MSALNWIKTNWLLLAKWGGLGFACLLVGVGAFVGARWVSSGDTYEGGLLDIAPADTAVVITVDNVPVRKLEFERFLDELVMQPRLPQLERSTLWKDNLGKPFDGSLERFRTEKYGTGLEKAEKDAGSINIQLFKDVFADELVICNDPARKEGESRKFVMLSRVSRSVRFKWQFMDMAWLVFPDGENAPRFDYSDGVLRMTPPATLKNPNPETTLITVLDDVLVVSNSDRLFNASLANHAGGTDAVSTSDRYRKTVDLVPDGDRQRHVSGVWLNLDRMRDRLPLEKNDKGEMVSPVDTFNGLPDSVVAIYPDVFAPVNRILEMNLDARPFGSAYYGLDITDPDQVRFDQYLLVNDDRVSLERYDYLRETWKKPEVKQTQLAILPGDTMMQVSYRQPVDLLYNEVFDAKGRDSLVGDFVQAVQRPTVLAQMDGHAQELMFATLPREFAPEASIPLSGTDMPLPGFVIGFRTQGANGMVAQALLQEYLYAQRGVQPGEEPKEGPVKVVRKDVLGELAYGFLDTREVEEGDENFIRRLNQSIRAALVGEWLLLTNSELLLSRAIEASRDRVAGLEDAPGSVWRTLPTKGNATVYLNFERFVDYAGSPELSKILRDNKYNPTLIDGRDPGELRREITRELGYDPDVIENLKKDDVAAEFERRKQKWIQTCKVEGQRYEAELQNDLNGLRFFRDLALITTFEPDHLHVQGVLRIGG